MVTQILSHQTRPAQYTAVTPEEKSRHLYELGYRAELCGTVLLVTNPSGRTYRVDPRRQECSCPATRRCCHTYGWFELAIAQADALCAEGCSLDMMADATRRENAYTAAGLGMRTAAVECYDTANALRCWAYDVKDGRI